MSDEDVAMTEENNAVVELCGHRWRGRGTERLTCALPKGHDDYHMTQRAVDGMAARADREEDFARRTDGLDGIRAFLLGGRDG